MPNTCPVGYNTVVLALATDPITAKILIVDDDEDVTLAFARNLFGATH